MITTPLNILIVDDSNLTIKKLTNLLQELGHIVVGVARSGRDAIEAYEQFNPDLVTMDITMPQMDGIEATRRIIEKFKDALIIMITSHGQEQMVIDAVKAGARGYIIKPFKKDKVEEYINEMIEKFMGW